MHSLHVPRQSTWGARKSVLVFVSVCLVFWTLVIWAVRALLS